MSFLRNSAAAVLTVAVAVALQAPGPAFAGSGSGSGGSTPAPTPTPTATSTGTSIAAAGDISCDPSDPAFNGSKGTASLCHMSQTARLLSGQNFSAILGLGDNQYDCASSNDLKQSWESTWGHFNQLYRPVPGNHEYAINRGGLGLDQYGSSDCGAAPASNYMSYFTPELRNFGSQAFDTTKGYYSYDVGAWHVVALNTSVDCFNVACSQFSPQWQWLKNDLATHKRTCMLAYMHYPLFASAVDDHALDAVKPLWDLLYASGVDVVLTGHAHNYERFAPMTPSGFVDNTKGIREFIVGTGGRSLDPAPTIRAANSLKFIRDYGILKMTLNSTSYSWQWLPEAGRTSTDSGTANCSP